MCALAAYPPVPQLDLLGDKRVAIVAERLIDMRGGERVVTAVADMLPHADIYATVIGDKGLPDFGGRRVHTSFVQGLPGAKRFFRAYLPLYPLAVEQLDLRRYDVVVSLSSAFAHGALSNADATHVCYCHTPLRFAWNYQHAYNRSSNPLIRSITSPLLHYVRSWDVAASHRVDSYVANSRNVQRRLWKYYRRDSTVIYPPVDTNRFFPTSSRGDHFLLVSSLSAYKRVDIAVAAFSRLGLPLYIVGSGADESRLKSRAASNVKFLGRVPDAELAQLYAHCRAFVFTSDDDFGIAPVEAQAAGRPVIAYAHGGALETVQDGVTGVLFNDQTAACLEETVRRFDPEAYRPAAMRANAMRFSIDRFQQEFGRKLVDSCDSAPSPSPSPRRKWPGDRRMAQATTGVSRAAAPAALNRISLPLLRVQERRLLLATVDAAIVFGVLMTAYDLWKACAHPAADNMATIPWAWVIGGAASWLTISWLSGAYDLAVADRLPAAVKRTLTVALFAGLQGLAAYWAFLKTYPRPALAIALVTVPVTVLVWRATYAALLRRPAGATRILVLGNRETYEHLIALTAANNGYYRIVGFVESNVAKGAVLADGEFSLAEVTQRTGAHRIVVAPRVELTTSVVASLTSAIERGVEVFDFNAAYEEIAGKVAVDHVGDHWLAALPTRPKTSSFEDIAMRALDVLGAAIGLLITGALFPFIALAIRLGSAGPVIYSQERLGRGGRPFTIFKFRSMSPDAESTGAQWAGHGDRRVTSFGHFLRRTHLDEMPQFWNILRGEMSMVGPRPERPEFTETLARSIPFYRLRLSVRPGLTGLKQIKVGYASSTEEHLEVLRHDLYYLKHRSLALNIAIVARTLGSVVGLDGR